MGTFRLIGQAARLSHAAGRSSGNAAERGLAAWGAGRGRRAVRQGLIGPWDPLPPAGSGGYLDFSGAARPGDLDARDWWFPLGRYVKPKHPWGPGAEIGLPLQEANRHTMVLGPTRGGKTAGLIAPWMVAALRAGYLVVSVDVKGNDDLLSEVTRYRDAFAQGESFPLRRWDYREPQRSKSWNFLAELDDDGAVNAAAEAICGRPRDADPNRAFHVRDLKWARGLLELAYDTGSAWNVGDLLTVLADPTALRDLVDKHRRSRGAQRLRDLVLMADDDFSRSTQFLATHFETLNTRGFNAVTTRQQLDLRRLAVADPGLVLVNAPIVDGALSEASSGLFVNMLLHRRLAAFGTAAPPMLLVLDESPRLQDRIDLGKVLSLAAGAGVSVLLAAQDVKQFEDKVRDEVLANCGTLVVLGGTGPETTDYVGRRLGQRVRGKQTANDSYDRRTGRTRSYGADSETVPVLDHNALFNPPSGRWGATVVNNRLSPRPVLVDLGRSDLL